MAKLIIKEEVYDKVMHWVTSSTGEVSGFGKVQVLDNGDFYIAEAYLIEQEVGATHTDIDASSLSKLMYESRETPGQLRWWWHSHVNMQVFWSGTDTATINQLGGQGWITATVFNKKHEYRSAICYQTEVKTPWGTKANLQLDDNVTLEIESTRYTQETIDAWNNELKAKVKTKQYTLPTQSSLLPTLSDDALPLLNGKQSSKSNKSAYDYDLEVYGAYGYGARIEAEALGMSLKKYREWLEDESPHPSPEWKKIDERLNQAWRAGKLDEIQDKFNRRGAL